MPLNINEEFNTKNKIDSLTSISSNEREPGKFINEFSSFNLSNSNNNNYCKQYYNVNG